MKRNVLVNQKFLLNRAIDDFDIYRSEDIRVSWYSNIVVDVRNNCSKEIERYDKIGFLRSIDSFFKGNMN